MSLFASFGGCIWCAGLVQGAQVWRCEESPYGDDQRVQPYPLRGVFADISVRLVPEHQILTVHKRVLLGGPWYADAKVLHVSMDQKIMCHSWTRLVSIA